MKNNTGKKITKLIVMLVCGLFIAGVMGTASPASVLATVSGDRVPPRIFGILIDGADFINGYGRMAPVTVSACDVQSGLGEESFACTGPYSDGSQDIDCGALAYGDNHFEVTENGTYYFAVKDLAGNTAVVNSEINCIDKEGPERRDIHSYIPGAVNGYGREVTLTIEAEDLKSGMAEEAYSFDGGETFTAENFHTFSENTEEVFVYRDALGNESSDDVVIECIDDQPPAIRAVKEEPISGRNGYGLTTQLCVDAADTKSGLSKYAYSFDDGKTYVSENRAEFSGNGVCLIRVRDGLGNETRKVATVSTVDGSGPAVVVSGNPTATVNTNVTLTVSVADSEAGLSSLWYQNDAVKSKKIVERYNGEKRGKEKVTITQNGTYTFFAYDELGNETKKSVTVSKIDRSYRSSSSTIRVTTPVSSARSSSSSRERSVTIGGDSSASSSSSRKSVVIGGGTGYSEEEDDYFDDEGGQTLFVGVSDNSVDDGPMNEEVYVPDTDVLMGELEENLSEGPIVGIDYPDEPADEGPTRGQIIAMGIGIVMGLLGLLMLILWKLGIITPSKLLRGTVSGEENRTADLQDTLADDDTTGTL